MVKSHPRPADPDKLNHCLVAVGSPTGTRGAGARREFEGSVKPVSERHSGVPADAWDIVARAVRLPFDGVESGLILKALGRIPQAEEEEHNAGKKGDETEEGGGGDEKFHGHHSARKAAI